MTSRQTAVPAREPAPGGTAGEPALAAAVRGPALARLLLTALLIAAVLVGLRGGLTLHGWHGRYHRDGIAIGIGLEAVLAGLLIALLIRGRQPSDDFRVLRIRSVLRFALLAGLAAIPAVLLLAAPLHPSSAAAAAAATQPQPTVYPRRPGSRARPPRSRCRWPTSCTRCSSWPSSRGSWCASCCCDGASPVMTRCPPMRPRWPRASGVTCGRRSAPGGGRWPTATTPGPRSSPATWPMERSLGCGGRGP